MQTRQLYASITATTAGTTYVELPTNARIKAIDITLVPTSVNAGDYCMAEISTNSANQTATNDAIGVITTIGGLYALTTSGAVAAGWSKNILCDVQLKAGDRVYINATENGSGTWLLRAVLHYS